jgi:murein L,D-transpeptidase YafK
MLLHTGTLRRLLVLIFLACFLAVSPLRAQPYPFSELFFGYSKAVNAVAVSPNGRQAVSAGEDNFLRLWDIPSGLLVRAFHNETGGIDAVAFSPDGRRILAAGNDDQLRLWDIAAGEAVVLEGHNGEVLAAAFSPDGRQLLSGSADKTAKLWDAGTGQLLKTFEGHAGGVLSVAFSSDGRRVLSASEDRTLKLWDIETGEALKTFEGHGDAVTSAAFSPDGKLALSASRDKTVKLWDAANGKLLKTIEGHTDHVLSAAFSPDGRKILSASRDGSLKLWDAGSGALLKTFEGHADAVTSAAFLPDSREALSGGKDKTLKLWDTQAGQLKRTIDLKVEPFAPNGRRTFGYFGFIPGISLPNAPDPARLGARLKEKGLKLGDPVYLRIFKGDAEAEMWVKRGPRFELFATYPICAWSGQLGPKLQEGDRQSPEGFYTIGKGQLNANSRYHRAFNLGFPNLYDAQNNRTGAALMVHGSCASAGCYAMTDPAIDELWALVTAALNGGQERVPVHVFPFRMTEERMAAFAWHPWIEFWRDLKPAYDLFEETRIPPQAVVCNKRYAVERGTFKTGELQAACPPGKGVGWHTASEPASFKLGR